MSDVRRQRGAGGVREIRPDAGRRRAGANSRCPAQTRGVMGGPKGAAARLGIKRSMLYRKMKKLGISRPE